jgi:hypothetical protein
MLSFAESSVFGIYQGFTAKGSNRNSGLVRNSAIFGQFSLVWQNFLPKSNHID